MFVVDQSYSKRDIYEVLGVPIEKRRGEWDKGYRIYEGDVFIFANVGVPGRTGHSYNNYWEGDQLVWEATRRSHIAQPQIQRMINPLGNQRIFLFTRTDDRSPFIFEGKVAVNSYSDSIPVKIVWDIIEPSFGLPQLDVTRTYSEGGVTRVLGSKYERNPLARRICISTYGAKCCVCGFDFYEVYGELGKGYIHVHHLTPISSIGTQYILDPKRDLVPVCPNCHSMLHRGQEVLLPETLRMIMQGKLKKP